MLPSQPSTAGRERIGRYQVLRKIATGGMAELYLAKQVGLDGFEKVVAIKRILSHLAHDQDFVQMFQDEARIVAKLHHPHIVQIFDLGKADDTYFIAMEYIPGRNLSSVAKHARGKGERLDPRYIARCISQACEGLYYAHTRHDASGEPLHIVHRDVSPQNIIVSFSGSVKLVDFGIAKAATKIAHTRAGVLKGKYAYMSPEQIRGETTDARSDLFAVGIVLYELLCGQRPFEKENSIQTLKAIVQEEPVPCQALNDTIADRLAAIIQRCLRKNPGARYQTAQEIQLDLEDFVAEGSERINNLVISNWMSHLFAEELAQTRGGPLGIPGLPPTEGAPAPKGNREIVVADAGAEEAGSNADDDDTPAPPLPELSLSRGRGGGSISVRGASAPPAPVAPSNALDEVRDPDDDVDEDVRYDLIEEQVIQPRGSVGESWDEAATVHLGTDGEQTEYQARVADDPAGRDADEGARDVLGARAEPDAYSEHDLMAPLGGDEGEFGAEDPWDEATLGLPGESEHPHEAVGEVTMEPTGPEASGHEEPEMASPPASDPSKGRAPRLRSVSRRRSMAPGGPIPSGHNDEEETAPPDEPPTRPRSSKRSKASESGESARPSNRSRLATNDASAKQAMDAAAAAIASGHIHDEASDASQDIWAAVERSTGLVDEDTAWMDEADESSSFNLDDPWGERTSADPGLFDESGGVGFEPSFEDEDSLRRFELGLEPAFDEPPADPTIGQASFDDATIDQVSFERQQEDATIDQAALAASLAEPAETPSFAEDRGAVADRTTSFSDERTVAYNDEFAPERLSQNDFGAADQTWGVAPAPDEEATVGYGDDADPAPVGVGREFSTVRALDEPVLPNPGQGRRPELDDRTIAGVTTSNDDREDEGSPVIGGEALPPTETQPAHDRMDASDGFDGMPAPSRRSSGVGQPIGAIRLDRRAVIQNSTVNEPMTELEGPSTEEVTVGDPLPAVAAPTDIPQDEIDSFFDHSGHPVQPSPLEAPPGEEDQISYQDEYSALVVQPKPLNAPPPTSNAASGFSPIGSTNVPPASLSLSQVLAHPAQAPRARLMATPRGGTVNSASARTASIRSASMVGRQIREVVRSAEPPGVSSNAPVERGRQSPSREPPRGPATSLPGMPLAPGETGPRLDLHGALEMPPTYDPQIQIAPANDARRWLAPVLAAMTVLFLAVAVYIALPYVVGLPGPHLTIKTAPVGASVLVDGTLQQGKTPLRISGLRPGVKYQIRLERSGYDPVEREIQIPEDSPLIVQIHLQKRGSGQK